MPSRYAICRRDGSLLCQEQGVAFTFPTMAEARSWCLEGESVVPAAQRRRQESDPYRTTANPPATCAQDRSTPPAWQRARTRP